MVEILVIIILLPFALLAGWLLLSAAWYLRWLIITAILCIVTLGWALISPATFWNNGSAMPGFIFGIAAAITGYLAYDGRK